MTDNNIKNLESSSSSGSDKKKSDLSSLLSNLFVYSIVVIFVIIIVLGLYVSSKESNDEGLVESIPASSQVDY